MGPAAALEQALKGILLPPASLLLLYLLGVLLRRRHARLSALARHGAVALLYVLSTGAGAWLLVHPLESLEPPLVPLAGGPARAIVVLTAGRIKHSPEYGGRAMPDFVALTRMTYAAHVVRATGLPVLVTGGRLSAAADDEPLALAMRRVLQDDLQVPVRWCETNARNTAENARFSAALLKQAGVSQIILVTDAMHMRRARRAFELQGIGVTPAPTFYQAAGRFEPLRLLPTAEHLRRSHYALYEWLGIAWYGAGGAR
jgi:uncharacterized SAM-binding protein YcdF (DUF218 family)